VPACEGDKIVEYSINYTKYPSSAASASSVSTSSVSTSSTAAAEEAVLPLPELVEGSGPNLKEFGHGE
jgi:hypothetical protein